MKLLLTIFAILSILEGCNRARRKEQQLLISSKEKISGKKDAILDKVWPQFDATTADTKNNKKRFKEFMHFEPGPDVKNLYCEDNRIGINSSFYFAFKCNDSTIEKIRYELKLSADTAEQLPGWFGLGACPMSWWDSATIVHIKPYTAITDHICWYLWYDRRKRAAFLETYDM